MDGHCRPTIGSLITATRGRKEIAVVTSDTDRLRETIGISAARQSATEMARQQPNTNSPEIAPDVPRSRDILPPLSAPYSSHDGSERKPQEHAYEHVIEPGWQGISR